jgi:hypothetical protein
VFLFTVFGLCLHLFLPVYACYNALLVVRLLSAMGDFDGIN